MDIHKITLRDLIRWGQPPLATDTLLSSAHYAHSELPIRLAHRIDAFRRLPFIVGTNPHIQHVHDCYLASFNALTAFKEIRSAEDDAQFTQILTDLTEVSLRFNSSVSDTRCVETRGEHPQIGKGISRIQKLHPRTRHHTVLGRYDPISHWHSTHCRAPRGSTSPIL